MIVEGNKVDEVKGNQSKSFKVFSHLGKKGPKNNGTTW